MIPLQEWERFYYQIFPSVITEFPPLVGCSIPEIDGEFSLAEIEWSLKKCKNNKSPGEDEITYEFLKNLPINWKIYINSLFNKIWNSSVIPEDWSNVLIKNLFKKGDASNPSNFRPIALIDCLVKIFTQIISNRLYNWCERNNKIPEFQTGFRKKRGCLDNIFVLNSVIQIKLQKPKSKVFTLFVDFKRAFPSVNHELLYKKLLRIGLSDKLCKFIHSLYSKAKLSVVNGFGTSNPIQVTEGLLQGEVLSPLLFTLFIQDLEIFLKSKGIRGVAISPVSEILLLAYADDIVILADSPAMMKGILKALNDYCNLNQLAVNTDKTNVVIFSKGTL